MRNTGLLKMFLTPTGRMTYTLTLTVFDIVGTLYPVNGSLLTIEEIDRQEDVFKNKNISPPSQFVKREIKYENIPQENIKDFLFDKTGSSQSDSIKRLNTFYSRGIQVLETSFSWD